jgi:CRP/FNR family transcriptional regulator
MVTTAASNRVRSSAVSAPSSVIAANAVAPMSLPSNVTVLSSRLREMGVGVDQSELQRLAPMVVTLKSIKRGGLLYRAGQRFHSIYAVHAGCFKTSVLAADGREQVTGFQITGDLLGLDGIAADCHTSQARALEDSHIFIIPFADLERRNRASAEFQRWFHKLMSQAIVSDQDVMMQLGRMRAEARIATFLLNLTQRLHKRGFSEFAVNLRMTRDEIGSYLGLTLETVSRIFSKLNDNGTLAVKGREVRILDIGALRHAVDGTR